MHIEVAVSPGSKVPMSVDYGPALGGSTGIRIGDSGLPSNAGPDGR